MIVIGNVYRFTKSGNFVRVLAASNYGGEGNFEVARVDSGKGMIVSGSALEKPSEEELRALAEADPVRMRNNAAAI